MTDAQRIEDLKGLILNLGDASANVIEQMLKGRWVDELGHEVFANKQMFDLASALNDASAYAEIHGPFESAKNESL